MAIALLPILSNLGSALSLPAFAAFLGGLATKVFEFFLNAIVWIGGFDGLTEMFLCIGICRLPLFGNLLASSRRRRRMSTRFDTRSSFRLLF